MNGGNGAPIFADTPIPRHAGSISVSRGVSRVPKHLRITQGMFEDLLLDPVMAFQVILGFKLDAFQGARLRYFWWVPEVSDTSGFSSAKTLVGWGYCQLRAILLPEQHVGVIYQTFDSGKRTFWPYYEKCRSPIFRAQLGRMDIEGEESGKSSSAGSACYKYWYKNGSVLEMPAPGHLQKALGQAGWRLNSLYWDEWTKAAGMNAQMEGFEEGRKQLIGRVSKPSWNQHHPIWSNHITLTATAELGGHPAYLTHQEMVKSAKRGNPGIAVVRWSYKDYSGLICHSGKTFREEYRVEMTIQALKRLPEDKFRAEALGIWSRGTKGWYTRGMLDGARELGRVRGVVPIISRAQDEGSANISRGANRPKARFYLGIDPAPAQGQKSDAGALVGLRAQAMGEEETDNEDEWQLDFVYARIVRGLDGGQWSSLVHEKNFDFGFELIVMDWGGGGQWIMPELRKTRQRLNGADREVQPIVTRDDKLHNVGQFILVLFKRSDPGIVEFWPEVKHARGDDVLRDYAEGLLQTALTKGIIGLPERHGAVDGAARAGWTQERYWASVALSTLEKEMMNTRVATTPDGAWALSSNGAKSFVCVGHDDLKDAARNAYLGFRIWLAVNMLGMGPADGETMMDAW